MHGSNKALREQVADLQARLAIHERRAVIKLSSDEQYWDNDPEPGAYEPKHKGPIDPEFVGKWAAIVLIVWFSILFMVVVTIKVFGWALS